MLTDEALKEIAVFGVRMLQASGHLYQMASELKAEASWAEFQGRAAILLAPGATDEAIEQARAALAAAQERP